jgi:3-oxoacyl-[acyl-carrier protein] reductase
MDLGLHGKACLVAGASRGIGRAIALALAREGARVAAVARGETDLAALAAELGEGHASIVADVVTAAGARAAVEGAVSAFGGLDIVISVVGKSFARDAATMDDDDFAKSLDMNLWSGARIAQRAVPHLIARGGGSITLITSIWGREAGGAPGYNVAKAGVVALAKALARDYAKHNIRVNSVAPGSILFPGGGWDRRLKADPDGIADMVKRELPFGRFGTPEEVADVVAFLASPRAQWIAGACIVVDGAQSRAF